MIKGSAPTHVEHATTMLAVERAHPREEETHRLVAAHGRERRGREVAALRDGLEQVDGDGVGDPGHARRRRARASVSRRRRRGRRRARRKSSYLLAREDEPLQRFVRRRSNTSRATATSQCRAWRSQTFSSLPSSGIPKISGRASRQRAQSRPPSGRAGNVSSARARPSSGCRVFDLREDLHGRAKFQITAGGHTRVHASWRPRESTRCSARRPGSLCSVARAENTALYKINKNTYNTITAWRPRSEINHERTRARQHCARATGRRECMQAARRRAMSSLLICCTAANRRPAARGISAALRLGLAAGHVVRVVIDRR